LPCLTKIEPRRWSEKQFDYAFTNTLTEEQCKVAHDCYAVPVSGRILFQGGFANVTPHAATINTFANDDRGVPRRGVLICCR
jgi:hypothetical protein